MNATHARAITNKNKGAYPVYMTLLLTSIKNSAEQGELHIYVTPTSKEQDEWLKKNGYKVEQCNHAFEGQPLNSARKISW